ncbi:MAG TPA: phasin family protein [Macromonas sp.]|nr:phasin family protein [Macromonas sp.]
MLTTEQLLAAHKANVETLFGLTQKAFEGLEKLVDLNLQATKAALSDSASSTQALLGVKDAQELLNMQANLMQPLAEKTAAYSRQLFEIASGAGSELTKVAEGQANEAKSKVYALVDSIAKNAPAGSESAVAIMKNAMSAAGNAMESVQKAVKQASEMAETNFQSMASTTLNATKAPTAKKR